MVCTEIGPLETKSKAQLFVNNNIKFASSLVLLPFQQFSFFSPENKNEASRCLLIKKYSLLHLYIKKRKRKKFATFSASKHLERVKNKTTHGGGEQTQSWFLRWPWSPRPARQSSYAVFFVLLAGGGIIDIFTVVVLWAEACPVGGFE